MNNLILKTIYWNHHVSMYVYNQKYKLVEVIYFRFAYEKWYLKDYL